MSLATRTKLALARSIFGQSVPDAAISYVWDNRYPVGTRGNPSPQRVHRSHPDDCAALRITAGGELGNGAS